MRAHVTHLPAAVLAAKVLLVHVVAKLSGTPPHVDGLWCGAGRSVEKSPSLTLKEASVCFRYLTSPSRHQHQICRPMNRLIICEGTNFEIGYTHGKIAKSRIVIGIENYTNLFRESVNLSWNEATRYAAAFIPALEKFVPHLLEEMRGIAAGAEVTLLDIIALNARSEIALTQSKLASPPDGCTAFSRLTAGHQWLQQNWDWKAKQLDQVVVLQIKPPGGPKITTITEAGLVAKVGMNERGVGVTLNALKTVQMDPTMLPIHIALRVVLESTSVQAAISRLEAVGVASAAHFLIADASSSMGVEVNPIGPFGKLRANSHGNVFHTNHCISTNLPKSLTEVPWLEDSPIRLTRIGQLVGDLEHKETNFDTVFEVFKDETDLPNAINRAEDLETLSGICTVFTVVMNCTTRELRVSFGRPTRSTEFLSINCNE